MHTHKATQRNRKNTDKPIDKPRIRPKLSSDGELDCGEVVVLFVLSTIVKFEFDSNEIIPSSVVLNSTSWMETLISLILTSLELSYNSRTHSSVRKFDDL